MGRDLRELLFELFRNWEFLKVIVSNTRNGLVLSDPERKCSDELIAFLEKIKSNAHRYVQGEFIQSNDKGDIFLDFLTALSLTEDERLNRGAVYAVQNVPLNLSVNRVDQAREDRVIQQLTEWIDILKNLDANTASGSVDALNGMLLRFEHTIDRLEESMRA